MVSKTVVVVYFFMHYCGFKHLCISTDASVLSGWLKTVQVTTDVKNWNKSCLHNHCPASQRAQIMELDLSQDRGVGVGVGVGVGGGGARTKVQGCH